jgi:rubrerythrin
MILRKIVSPDNEEISEELWVCTVCGYTRKL